MTWTAEYPNGCTTLYIHEDGSIAASEEGVWLPGLYESRKAALTARFVDPARLAQLAEAAKQRGTPITEAELA